MWSLRSGWSKNVLLKMSREGHFLFVGLGILLLWVGVGVHCLHRSGAWMDVYLPRSRVGSCVLHSIA